MRTRVAFRVVLVSFVAVAAGAGACSSGSTDEELLSPSADGGANNGFLPGDDASFHFDGGALDPDAAGLVIEPANPVVDVTVGAPAPAINFVAKASGTPIAVAWGVDRGEIGAIGVSTGVFTPTGNVGGKAVVTATYGSKVVTTTVTVRLKMFENGATSSGPSGSGGAGGVGGEGPGGPVDDATKAVLASTPIADPSIGWLYPYDGTVWPRGILAPLLQWWPDTHQFDAVQIKLKENAFEYVGTFAKTKTPFDHHPIPQEAWKKLTNSNGGEPVEVELTFARGGKAYGPLKQTWKVASGPLKGTVYYNSYGTRLAKNYCCTPKGEKFGGAILAIKGGSTDPTLVAGGDGGSGQCRVCHSVSANGSSMIAQWGDNYSASSGYDLTASYAEIHLAPKDGRFAWPAIAPDGLSVFTNSSPARGGTDAIPSGLYALPSGAPIATSGLPAGLKAGYPAFSPDGRHISFAFHGGPGADDRSLAAIDFDPVTKTFSGLTTLHTPPVGYAVWSSWLPNSAGVVFQVELASNGRDYGGTRAKCDNSPSCYDSGARGEIWWVDAKTKIATRLDKLNGKGYLPIGPNGHHEDWTLNFEPSVNPVVSGGYAWVVFVSRRMYGNVALINPYWSDPRYHDLSAMPTPKKLWVAAIDLDAKPGTDPSFPAFYLPGQELLAGNSRGFWVVDPCKSDGSSCETGDECCGGFCQPGSGGGLVCTNTPPSCAAEYEKCSKDEDCCGLSIGVKCIGGRCAAAGPK